MSDYPPEPEPCRDCWYATGQLMVCAGFCDLVTDERSARTAFALFEYGREQGRAEVQVPVEAVLAECDRRLIRAPDRVLQFWVGQVRAAIREAG